MRKEGKRKALAALVCGSMLTVALVGGTLAYLTDTDSDVNVMTVGNVSIEQIEQQLAEDGVTHEPFEQGKGLYPGTEISKIVSVKNTGKSDVYFRTLIAFEDVVDSETFGVNFPISEAYKWSWEKPAATIEIDGVTYQVYEAVYNSALKAGAESPASLTRVEFARTCTNEDMELLGDTYEILVLSQAGQVEGFADAATALNTMFGDVTNETAKAWFSGDEFEIPTAVATAAELTDALAAGKSVYLTKDITDVNANTAITVANGKEVTLNLNGHKLAATADKSGNQELFLVTGTLNVENGTIELIAKNNQAWNAMATIFDVTAGGVLNMEGVTASTSGTDMNFIVHLNNWGEVTLNANKCVFDATYCGVRVFNSGFDMNNVTITNSILKGKTRAFWVQHYIGDLDPAKHSDEAINARLNLDIYGNNNTFDITDTATSPIRYGNDTSTSVYFDANGNKVL